MNRPNSQRSATAGSARGGRHGLSKLGLVGVIAASGLALLAPAASQAATVTVGSVLPAGFTSKPFTEVETLFNTALPEKGANLTSPVNGAVVRWRIQGGSGGPFVLRVLRPNGSGAYMAAGTSTPATPAGPGLQTFNANVPIQSGDVIGIDPTGTTDQIGIAEVAGASFASIFPPPIDGSTVPPRPARSGQEIELSAEIQPAPAITGVSPSSGSIAGGTKVTITGTNLNAASAVKFGATPATSFTAESETQITAVAPSSKVAGRVDVSVATLAGASPTARADTFTYNACIVPKLKKRNLKQTKNQLRSSGCKLGKVQGNKKSKTAKVVKQSPKPGVTRTPGAKVNVKLSE